VKNTTICILNDEPDDERRGLKILFYPVHFALMKDPSTTLRINQAKKSRLILSFLKYYQLFFASAF